MINRHLRIASYSATFIVGLIFLLAGLSKIGEIGDFYHTVTAISFLPQCIKGMIVFVIPAIELVIGFCLIIRTNIKEALFFSCLLLAIFVGFDVYNNIAQPTHSCGCFKLQIPAWFNFTGWWDVPRNIVFLLFGVYAFLTNDGETCSPDNIART